MTDPPPNSVSLAAMWAVTLPSPHPTSSIFSPPESMQWAKNVSLASLINNKLFNGLTMYAIKPDTDLYWGSEFAA